MYTSIHRSSSGAKCFCTGESCLRASCKKYPASFQSPLFLQIDMNAEEEIMVKIVRKSGSSALLVLLACFRLPKRQSFYISKVAKSFLIKISEISYMAAYMHFMDFHPLLFGAECAKVIVVKREKARSMRTKTSFHTHLASQVSFFQAGTDQSHEPTSLCTIGSCLVGIRSGVRHVGEAKVSEAV
jgi:hypothetical protein